MFGIMLALLIAASFTEQTMYEYTVRETGVPVMAALLDVLFCLLFLVTLTSIRDIGRLTRDRALLSQMLDERRHQYEMSARTAAPLSSRLSSPSRRNDFFTRSLLFRTWNKSSVCAEV